ncbi:MAG: TIGR02281 family clan AA aspartic protease [Hyphomicrobiales bacterium]|nr:TIGR02281 family clan AA aspartic protease [Hyphomicrobiales bacterium]
MVGAVVATQVLSHANLAGLGNRPAPAPAPVIQQVVAAVPPPSAPEGVTATLRADSSGNFGGRATIDGAEVAMMIDTGASFVALTHHDAVRLGIAPAPGDYNLAMSTANGISYAARVHLDSIEIGQVRIEDVPAIVAPPRALGRTLIGMNFLRRLRKFQVQGNRLKLTQ